MHTAQAPLHHVTRASTYTESEESDFDLDCCASTRSATPSLTSTRDTFADLTSSSESTSPLSLPVVEPTTSPHLSSLQSTLTFTLAPLITSPTGVSPEPAAHSSSSLLSAGSTRLSTSTHEDVNTASREHMQILLNARLGVGGTQSAEVSARGHSRRLSASSTASTLSARHHRSSGSCIFEPPRIAPRAIHSPMSASVRGGGRFFDEAATTTLRPAHGRSDSLSARANVGSAFLACSPFSHVSRMVAPFRHSRTPSRGSRVPSACSVASDVSSSDRAIINRFGLSLNASEFTLDRAQSYVVREHTVVVGDYRINQNGLYPHAAVEQTDECDCSDWCDEAHTRNEDQIERRTNELQAAPLGAQCSVLSDDPSLVRTSEPLPPMSLPGSPTARAFTRRSRASSPTRSRRGSFVADVSSSRRQSLVPPVALSLRREDLIQLEVIGRGQNGHVRKALHLPTMSRVALKTMDVYDKSMRHQLVHELHAFSGLESDYLIRLIGAYHESGVIYLATEYMDCGSLTHCMKRHGGLISDELILKHLSCQLLRGLAYLHAHCRVHRDIKPDNILLNHRGEVRIGDFGLMASLDEEKPTSTDFVGTLAYLAPERLSSAEYGSAADIFSLGVSLIYASTSHLPIVGGSFWEFLAAMEQNPPSLAHTIDEIRNGNKKTRHEDAYGTRASDTFAAEEAEMSPVLVDETAYAPKVVDATALHFSSEYHHFISCMLHMNPDDRWSAASLLQHPFLADVDDTLDACRAHPFWSHASVVRKNEADLECMLEVIAERQLSQVAAAAANTDVGAAEESSYLKRLVTDAASPPIGEPQDTLELLSSPPASLSVLPHLTDVPYSALTSSPPTRSSCDHCSLATNSSDATFLACASSPEIYLCRATSVLSASSYRSGTPSVSSVASSSASQTIADFLSPSHVTDLGDMSSPETASSLASASPEVIKRDESTLVASDAMMHLAHEYVLPAAPPMDSAESMHLPHPSMPPIVQESTFSPPPMMPLPVSASFDCTLALSHVRCASHLDSSLSVVLAYQFSRDATEIQRRFCAVHAARRDQRATTNAQQAAPLSEVKADPAPLTTTWTTTLPDQR